MKTAAWLLIFVTLSPLAVAQTTQPATQPSQFEIERMLDLQKVEAEASVLPTMRVQSIERLSTFSIEDGMLDVRTPLPLQDNDTRLLVPGMKGVVTLKFFGRRRGDDTAGYYFSITHADLTNPKAGEVFTTISAAAGHIMLTREAESETRNLSVQLLQDAPPLPGEAMPQPPELPVKLYISDQHGEQQPLKLKLMARDFVTLRLEHPEELDRYVRPIARDLHQERALFALPTAIAWQIAGLDYEPDAATQFRVGAIISRLDADDFARRQQAAEELKQMGPLARLSLARIDTKGLSLQQQSEIAAIIEQSAPVNPDILRPLRRNQNLLIDILYLDDTNLRQYVVDRLSKMEGRTLHLDSVDDNVIEKLREELIPTTQPSP